MKNEAFRKFICSVRNIADGLEEYHQFIGPEFIQDFIDKSRRTEEHAEEIMNKNRDLKIGIVGQVKAGKSSFLNAMIFDGKDILPKAATPMTAALTKIDYADEQTAKVVFYSKRDWEVIEKLAEKYDVEYDRLVSELRSQKKARAEARSEENKILGRVKQTVSQVRTYINLEPTERELQFIKQQILPQYRSCKELMDMAARDESIFDKLDSEENVSVLNLEHDLEQYVGANGRYTPIVKYIELGVNNDLVKGIEIVDTPGLGDPITSRSEKTKEFLMACDAVFLLSPSPQFLKREDLELIMNTLPGEGINHAVLVGSQFDLAMLDDSARDRQPLGKVLRRTRDKLNESAQRTLSEARKAETGYVHGKVLEGLEKEVRRQIGEEKSLYYTASLMHNIARHIENGESLNSEEDHIIQQFDKRFDGMKSDPDFLKELAGIDRLRSIEFDKLRKEKEAIIAERSASFAKEQAHALQKQLNTIQMEGENYLHSLQSEDIESLQKKLTTSQEAISSMRRDIRDTFEICAADTKKYMVGIANSIRSRVDSHTTINKTEETEVHHRSRKTGWWIFGSTERWTETEYYKAANVADAISNIHQYIRDADKAIAAEMDKIIDIASVRNKVKGVVLRAFEKADANYDENDIIGPVEVLLTRLTVPEFTVVDSQKYEQAILEKFPNTRVTNEEIASLELKQALVLNEIAKDISERLEERADAIAKMLEDQSINFTDDVKKQIEIKIKLLMDSLEDKQGSIEKYTVFMQRLAEWKQELRGYNL